MRYIVENANNSANNDLKYYKVRKNTGSKLNKSVRSNFKIDITTSSISKKVKTASPAELRNTSISRHGKFIGRTLKQASNKAMSYIPGSKIVSKYTGLSRLSNMTNRALQKKKIAGVGGTRKNRLYKYH
jgi:hypothetical protein